MGRPQAFDRDIVLRRAGELFWRRGYEVVSIPDLESATGLGRGSLYNAFGDKEGLFLAALEHYVAQYGSAALGHLANPDVGEGLRRMLAAIIDRMSNPANPPGCLLTNTSLGAGDSARIDAEAARHVAAMDALLEQAIRRARDEGQIPPQAEPRQLARFYGAIIHGLGVVHKRTGDVAALRDIAAVALRSWPAWNGRAASA